MKNNDFLREEDYSEPCCPFTKPNEIKRIPIARVVEKLDEYLARKDFAAAERHLKFWISEAELERDGKGKLSVMNEQIGLYRKLGEKDKCIKSVENALKAVNDLGLADTVTAGTVYLNAATGYRAFEMTERSIPLYSASRDIYEAKLGPNDPMLGALYNNFALALSDLARFKEARELFEKAISIMSSVKNGALEVAITYCNLCDLASAQYGAEESEGMIDEYLSKAAALLSKPDLPEDGYTAFVLEKCAPTFGYYGYFMQAKAINERAKRIYERY